MLEPRRIAAVSAARWMAKTLGEQIGWNSPGSPICSPRVLAIHRAAETAAIRRGSSIRIRPFSGGIPSSSARGVRVVFRNRAGLQNR